MAEVSGMDGVLGYLGAPHPCISVHLLLALGMAVLGLGSVEVMTMFPLPIYGCWGGMSPNDFGRTCEGLALLPETDEDDWRNVQECYKKEWQPYTFPGGTLVGIRVLVMMIAGLCFDVFGRRRSVVVWMGLYFVVAFARSFSPNPESVVFCVTLEGAAAQASALALLLLATEGSTQRECVRSACLVLLGHAVGVAGGTPIIRLFIHNHVYKQMARSLPALVFVLFIFLLPESARWAVVRGRVSEATQMLKKSHHATFDPALKHKLSALYEEHKLSMAQHNTAGRALKESLQPVFKSRHVFCVWFLYLFCGVAFGCGAGGRDLFDPLPYNSYEDRQIAFGITEFLALLVLGFALARVSVKWVQAALAAFFSVSILLAHLLEAVGAESCGGNVFFSCLGYGAAVMAGVWMGVGAMRLAPTHCRGLVLGSTFAMATMGNALAWYNVADFTYMIGVGYSNYATLGLWSVVAMLGGIMALFLPRTPPCLPDTVAHMTLHTPSYEKCEEEEELQNTPL